MSIASTSPIFNVGDLAVATDSKDRYCVFLTRHSNGWTVFSFEKRQPVFVSDDMIETLLKIYKFRVVESGFNLDSLAEAGRENSEHS